MPTVEHRLRAILGSRWRSCPRWPVDLFAATSTIVQRTGAYERTGDVLHDPTNTSPWPPHAKKVGHVWRNKICRHLDKATPGSGHALPPAPDEVKRAWRAMIAARHLSLSEVRGHDALASVLIQLVSYSDGACFGLGIRAVGHDGEQDTFLRYGFALMLGHGYRSLCKGIEPRIARVLPKQHVPASGLTLRSTTHHLALLPSSGVDAKWHRPWNLMDAARQELDLFNILALPWPLNVRREHFALASPPRGLLPHSRADQRFVAYNRPSEPDVFRDYLDGAVKAALLKTDDIDAIVLPECALTIEEFKQAREVAWKHKCLLITGVTGPEHNELAPECTAPTNMAVLEATGWSGLPGLNIQHVQHKHHRWRLDQNQIKMYGLESRLPASCQCWEHIAIAPRQMNFFTVDRWLTFGMLICEDLARQDPMADVIRSVGPNLIIALLMDAPQISTRWGARYAAVLADDPGSSVLSLTSLGMSKLSKPWAKANWPTGRRRERVIALWRDAFTGDVEIELAKGQHAALLSIVRESREEFTADGRGDGSTAHYPVLSGWQGLSWDLTNA